MNANETLFQSVRELNTSQIDEKAYAVCLFQPAHTSSLGIWGDYKGGGPPMQSSFPVFMLQIMVIFLITQACHFILKRLGFPVFVSQMMAGLILGPSLSQGNIMKYKKKLFPFGSQEPLATITSFGFQIFIFLTGVQMDFSMIMRTGKRSWTIAFLGLAVPLMIGYPSTLSTFRKSLDDATGNHAVEIPVVFISHSITSFAVIASLLNELKIINSELGRLALVTSLVSDVLSTTVTSMGTAIVGGLRQGTMNVWTNLAGVYAFAIFVPLLFRPPMLWIVKYTPEGRPVRDIYTYSIILIVLSLGWLSAYLGQDFSLGAFLLGLAVPEGPPLGAALVKKLELIGTYMLLPVFVTTCMMKADLTVPYSPEFVAIVIVVVACTHIIKMTVSIVVSLCCKMPIIDALTLALILNCKGVVEVCSYSGLLDRRSIQPQTYSIMMVCTMVIASFVQLSVKLLYDPSRKYAGYQRRNIMGLKQNAELRVLSCVHRHYHITPMTNLLSLCYPTADKPIVVDALHLIELVGRSLPIFISHRFKGQQSGSHNYSDSVILGFNLFQHENPGATSVNIYTAISPPALMHEDVCNLALDKLAAIIILPFHRRWAIDGGIETDDKNIRAVNCNVMERAPCSVGILVSRGSLQAVSTNFRLAVVFLGGKDDREALCLAKRAMREPQIHLVVYYIIEYGSARRTSYNSLDYMLDQAVLKEIKDAHSSLETVTYREIVSEDGPQTASVLRAMTEEHDFFIVGRRHDESSPLLSGLADWVEFSELGVVGDLLASTDVETKASVLVVQQQELLHK